MRIRCSAYQAQTLDVVGVTLLLSTDGLKRFSALKIPAQITAVTSTIHAMLAFGSNYGAAGD